MIKKQDIYSAAFDKKHTALEEKKRLHEAKLQAAYLAEPRLGKIDTELAQKGAKIAITALSGDSTTLAALKAELSALSEEKKSIIKQFNIEDIEYDCTFCNDTGYVNGKVCECVKTLAKQIAFDRLSEEMPLTECRFDNFDLKYYPDQEDENGINPRKKMTAVLKLCREYVLNFDKTNDNLLFLGDAGLGKTHLTLAIVSGILDKGYNVIYGSSYNLLSAVEKEHFSGNSGDSYETMLDSDLLVIDDLGAEFTSPFTLSVLYNLINTRILFKKATIINTNLSLTEIEKRYTPRIASRLMGNYTARKFFGRDIRQLKALEKL